MKKENLFLIIITLMFLAALTGCAEKDPVSFICIPGYPNLNGAQKGVLALELEHHFDNDSIWLRLDGLTILSDKITTDYTISAAWLSGPFDWPKGEHTLSVYHGGEKTLEEYNFTLQDTVTIRITYNINEKEFGFYKENSLIWWRD